MPAATICSMKIRIRKSRNPEGVRVCVWVCGGGAKRMLRGGGARMGVGWGSEGKGKVVGDNGQNGCVTITKVSIS